MATAKVRLEIQRGRGDRAKYLYAQIICAEDMPLEGNSIGTIFVAADLEYCLECLKNRRYELVNGVEALDTVNTILRGMM